MSIATPHHEHSAADGGHGAFARGLLAMSWGAIHGLRAAGLPFTPLQD